MLTKITNIDFAENMYTRIIKGNPFHAHNLKVYTIEEINNLLKTLEEWEEYEKCQIIKTFKEKRFDHFKNYIEGC
jgi:hypothetical protein